jgi:hypothetical protein
MLQVKRDNAGAASRQDSKGPLLEATHNQAAGCADWQCRSKAACRTARDNRCALGLSQHVLSFRKSVHVQAAVAWFWLDLG